MDRSIMIAYTEVDTILNLMEEEYTKKIPTKLRNLIAANKLIDYNIEINLDMPLEEQKISQKAVAILAFLNYKYWCENEEERKNLLKKYEENERKEQDVLKQQYITDNKMFLNQKSNDIVTDKLNKNEQIIVVSKKDNIIKRIVKNLVRIFKH